MQNKSRLWKVRFVHKAGYEASYFFVETHTPERFNLERAKDEARKEAKMRSRLADFPKKWEIVLEKTDKILKKDKWIDPEA